MMSNWSFCAFLQRNRRAHHVEVERGYYQLVTKMAEPPEVKQALRLGDILNTKASALLTHVSIMIAVSAALFSLQKPSNEGGFIKMALACEILVYVMATILILLSVGITGPKSFSEGKEAPVDTLFMIIRLRRGFYKFGLFITIAATIGLFFIASAELYNNPR